MTKATLFRLTSGQRTLYMNTRLGTLSSRQRRAFQALAFVAERGGIVSASDIISNVGRESYRQARLLGYIIPLPD